MSEYYSSQRTRNLYDPKGEKPFKISRSKIELFTNCPRCFYLDRRLGVGQPPGFPFNLNSAVDTLLKKEFDHYRQIQEPHPLMADAGIDGVPFQHDKMDEWRDSLRRGIQFHHAETNLMISGGVDDLWVTPTKELIIVDYKATSKNEPVSLDAKWQDGYKRQMAIYSWLFKKNGFKVFRSGYFVYCNGKTDRAQFNSKLDFDISILPYQIDDSWVDDCLLNIKKTLDHDTLPLGGEDCDFCSYFISRTKHDKI